MKTVVESGVEMMIDIYNAIGVQVNTFDCKYDIKDKPKEGLIY
jgi:hypothetical protein